jgi:hypothetical protein
VLENYETVAERLARFWAKYPNGSILTEMVKYDGEIVIFRAECYFDRNDNKPAGTGYAEERFGTSNVNKTSFVENCESSAVGRCLSNGSFASSDPAKRPSREEMAKVQRSTSSSAPQHTGTKTITNKMKGKCVDCGGTVDIGEGLATNDGSGWKTHHRPDECPPDAF